VNFCIGRELPIWGNSSGGLRPADLVWVSPRTKYTSMHGKAKFGNSVVQEPVHQLGPSGARDRARDRVEGNKIDSACCRKAAHTSKSV